MLPEALKRIINNRYVHTKGDDASISHLSIEQLNNYFLQRICRVNQESIIYSRLKADKYYVITGFGVEELEFIPGSFILDFTVAIPSLEYLKNKVRAQGVPSLDREASAYALELLFGRELSYAQEELRRYVYYICNLHDPKEVTRKTLFSLFHKISEIRSVHLIKLQYSGLESQRRFYSRTVKEFDKQLSLLSNILRDKGP